MFCYSRNFVRLILALLCAFSIQPVAFAMVNEDGAKNVEVQTKTQETQPCPCGSVNCEDLEFRKAIHNPANEMRPCPHCHAPAFKDGHSNPVRCGTCHKEFHFIKGMPREGGNLHHHHDFNPRDEQGNEILPPRLYKIQGDEGYEPGMECAFTDAE